MVAIWNDRGAYLSPYRTVFAQEASGTLDELDAAFPNEIGQGNYIKAAYDETLLSMLRDAYVESRDNRA